jgi:hypothetical protein
MLLSGSLKAKCFDSNTFCCLFFQQTEHIISEKTYEITEQAAEPGCSEIWFPLRHHVLDMKGG